MYRLNFLFLILLFAGYSEAQYTPDGGDLKCGSCFRILEDGYLLQPAYPNLTFQALVDFQIAGDGTNRIFVVEQAGRIKVFNNSTNTASSKTFLDITDRVTSGGEMGLLGLAFHPDYKNNGYFYVDYTIGSPRQTRIARFKVTSNPDSADKSSEEILLTVDQPFPNHKGGQTVFGPDGYLYISFGDGGSSGDPNNNAQNLGTLLGKIIRIDVNSTQGNLKYAIPPDNPFIASLSARAEIYAYGLRNPWRFSFDNSGRLWCADVGQNAWEEIDTIIKGHNYGWRIMEGTHCYNPSSNCDTTGITLPIHEYGHNSTGGNSVTGGFVYDGTALPVLRNRYIFADYVSKRIWSLGYYGINANQPVIELLLTASSGITSFGIDQNKELYICCADGKIYKIISGATGINDLNGTANSFELFQNYPNPFNPSTNMQYAISSKQFFTLKVFDILGTEVATLVNEEKEPGEYEVKFVATNLSSGIYFYELTAGSFKQSRKMLLLK